MWQLEQSLDCCCIFANISRLLLSFCDYLVCVIISGLVLAFAMISGFLLAFVMISGLLLAIATIFRLQ